MAAAQINGPLNVNAAPQQPRLSVDFVTGERAIAAAHAQIHVHHQQVHAINDTCPDFLLCRRQLSLVLLSCEPRIVVRVGQRAERFAQSLAQLRLGLQTRERISTNSVRCIAPR